MHTIFIADTHLTEEQPEITQKLLKFLATTAIHAEALYILGDFFNVWIGDDDNTSFHQTIIDALKNLTSTGVKLYLMHGNRDFLLGKRFARATNCCILHDPTVINIYGKRVLLTHGDLLCTHDLKYLIFRKKVRNWITQKLFLCKSLKKRREIANNMRKASQLYNVLMPDNLLNITQSEVENFMRKYKVDMLIHGHLHNAIIDKFSLDGRSVQRIVLGDWQVDKGSILICSTNEATNELNFHLQEFS